MKCFYLALFLILPITVRAQEFPDVEAEFPGGAKALMEFIEENRRNPLTPKDDDCKVYVSFIVARSGELDDITVERGCSPVLDSEALRIFTIMPNWIPGLLDGEPVITRCRMPIVFAAPSRKEWRQLRREQ